MDDALVIARQLRWPKLERQLVQLSIEAERHLIVLVLDWCSGINAHVEGFVDGHEEWRCVWDFICRNILAVHAQDARTALAETGAVVLEVERDGVFAGSERLLPLPAITL